LGRGILLIEKTPDEGISSVLHEPGFFADLIFAGIWLITAMAAIYLPALNESPLRIVLTLPAILFIPGYCLIAALFPKKDDIGLVERIMLSIGFSIAIVPLIGLGLNFTSWGIRLDPIVVSLTLFSGVMIIAAFYSRVVIPSRERFRMPIHAFADRIRRESVTPRESRIDRFLNVVLTILILVAVITTVYVVVVPKEGERFTEFYLLNENRTAADYPAQIITGRTYPLYIGVGNQENRDMAYTIETWMLRTKFDNVTNTSRIIAMDSNNYLSFVLANNETTIIPYNLSVGKTGYNEVEFLLFNETVPGFEETGRDRINASYRNLHLWLTVEQG
jgi:uncharacterized membrane protein